MLLRDLLYIAVGLVGLYFGADWLVKGASRLASSFGISPLVIGLTVVAIGTSMPELIVSLTAALQDNSEIAVGNVVGSNIANIGLILGVSGMLAPFLAIHTQLLRRELPIMIGVSILVVLMALDGQINRLEGVVLVIGMIVFTGISYRFGSQDPTPEIEEFKADETLTKPTNRLLELGRLVVGIGVLLVAARLLVDGAIGIALEVGISKVVIGFTLVAIGTSLPELATSVVAAMKKETDIAVGNVVGSNIANLLFILGSVSVVSPIPIDKALLRFEFPVMVFFAALMIPFALDYKLQRREAIFFLGGYVAFCVALFVRSA